MESDTLVTVITTPQWTWIDQIGSKLLSAGMAENTFWRMTRLIEIFISSQTDFMNSSGNTQITEQVTVRHEVLAGIMSRLRVRTVQFKLCNRINDCAQISNFCVCLKKQTMTFYPFSWCPHQPLRCSPCHVRSVS